MVWLLENDITGVFDDETFTVSTTDDLGRQEQLVEIVEGGKDLIVTNENKHDFVDKMWRWREIVIGLLTAVQLVDLRQFISIVMYKDSIDKIYKKNKIFT